MHVFMVSILAFLFKIIRPFYFLFYFIFFRQESTCSTVKEIFFDKFFESEANFPQLQKFCKVKKIFHKNFCKQGSFPQNFFSLIKEDFHKKRFLQSQKKKYLQTKIKKVL